MICLASLLEKGNLPLLIRGRFYRFREKLPFAGRRLITDETPASFIPGIKGAGKSSLAEALGTHFVDLAKQPQKTGDILDFFGSKDNEGLAWCRSPYDKILFIISDSASLSCSWDVKAIKDIRLSDFDNYQVVVAVSAFFQTVQEEFWFIRTIMDKLWYRESWRNPWYLAIRETANLIHSRLTIGEDQAQAKAYFIYVMREMRHQGYAIGADAIRMMAVDIDLRDLADYTFFKAPGKQGIPREARYLYHYFDPYKMMRMPQHRFILLTQWGTIAAGEFEYPWWHKKKRENMRKLFDIQIEFGDAIDYGEKGFKKVSDFDHEKFIIMRYEDEDGNPRRKPLSMAAIAEQTQKSSRTIWNEITTHNTSVERRGACPRCARIKSHMQTQQV